MRLLHFAMKLPKNPLAYACAICQKLFLNPAHLVKHVEIVHEPELSPEKSSVGLIPKEKDPIDKENVDPGNNKEVSE